MALADAHEKAQRMVARAGVDADPIEHLLESLHHAAMLVYVWGHMVADLDHAGEVELEERPGRVRGWAERSYDVAPDGKVRSKVDMDPLMVQTSDKTVQLHPFVREYHAAIERRAKLAKLCLDAGVQERRVQLAERQAEELADAIRAILDDLGVGDSPDAPAVVRRHLTALSGGRELEA